MGDALKRALMRVEARKVRGPIPEDYESPLQGVTAWHATRAPMQAIYARKLSNEPSHHLAPWTTRGRPNLGRGEGFGLHVGTESSALQRITPRVYDENDSPVFIDVVARPGRAIFTGDLGHFGDAGAWSRALQRDEVRGLSGEEKESLNALTEGLIYGKIPWTMPYGRRLRKALLGMGIDRVRYINDVEDQGSESVALLDPRKVRWGSLAEFNPDRKHWPNLLAGVGGALGTGALLSGARRDRAAA